ncbi:hypothetical protein HS088_TW10G00549 [Tripterygium wilfordii]|uniref:Heparan-alpha-glucosaminide N-acetyltransferase catalytic domain-containing protein n=1 Tax=Tripterygium wilfordii TaxID=458696 RepID=A0A7J7D5J4_TRIWF|nr:hypothetical protein HS088_TW10G00549 [Tripterygium wilfordii]
MATDIVAQDEEQAPLLQDVTNSAPGDEGIEPASSNGPESPVPVQRLVSLDVFRGLTIALMILVDDAGGDIPSINHSPWFGVTLADFVMPFFLFGVGISICLAFKKISSKSTATKKVILRFTKLFLLGILLQGIFLSILFIRRVGHYSKSCHTSCSIS